jgi:hypothetical protein
MDWQSLLDDTRPRAVGNSTPDETKYLLGLAVIAGVMAFGLVAAMLV